MSRILYKRNESPTVIPAETVIACLYLQSYSGSANTLACDLLKSPTGVNIPKYLISWHKDSPTGEILFRSGVSYNYEPLIDITHPFSNYIVPICDLYPVLEYVYIYGQRYTSNISDPNGGIYNAILADRLPNGCNNIHRVAIIPSECSNGNTVSLPVDVENVIGTVTDNELMYSHKYIYNSVTDPLVDSSRVIRFNLNSDGSSKYLAWKFITYEVADQITINYIRNNAILETLEDWIVGSNLSNDPLSFTYSPKRFNGTSLRIVTDVSKNVYQAGDYLEIIIVPRVIEVNNTNTNWKLYLKCIYTFDDFIIPSGVRDIDINSISMVKQGCNYNLKFKTLTLFNLPKRYLYTHIGTYQYGFYDSNTGEHTAVFYKETFLTARYQFVEGACVTESSGLNFTKNGSNVFITFDSDVIYNAYYNAYITAKTWNDGKVGTFYMKFNIGNSCGDNMTYVALYIGNSSTFTWDSIARTLSISMQPLPPNPYTLTDCDNSYTVYDTFANTILYNIDTAIPNFYTKCHPTVPIIGSYIYNFTMNTGSVQVARISEIYPELIRELAPVSFNNSGAAMYTYSNYPIVSPTKVLKYVSMYARITNMSDPINNFRISTTVDSNGLNITETIVYEKANGVQIIP